MHHSFVESFGLLHLSRIVWIEHEGDVKITVAGMADDRRRQKGSGEVLLGFSDAFGQPLNRHVYIGRPELRAVAQRLIGVDHVMSPTPKLVAILGLRCPA